MDPSYEDNHIIDKINYMINYLHQIAQDQAEIHNKLFELNRLERLRFDERVLDLAYSKNQRGIEDTMNSLRELFSFDLEGGPVKVEKRID